MFFLQIDSNLNLVETHSSSHIIQTISVHLAKKKKTRRKNYTLITNNLNDQIATDQPIIFTFPSQWIISESLKHQQDVKSYANLGQNSAYQLSGRLKDNRGTSLPPSALPRPARSLKPPRKIEYDRLSDSSNKARSQTPPKLSQSSPFEMKAATMKRNEYMRRDFTSPAKNYVEMKEMLNFPNPHFSLKRKDYGSMTKSEFSRPEHTSTKYYQRLEESPKSNKTSDNNSNSGNSGGGVGAFKRSLLPSARKYSPAAACSSNKQHSRDSLNSSESNHSVNSNLRQSPIHLKVDVHNASNASFHQHINSRTPPKYMSLAPQDKTASLPPKPIDNRNGRRGSSVTRGENRYKIQF